MTNLLPWNEGGGKTLTASTLLPWKVHFLVPQFFPSTPTSRHTTYILTNHLHSLRISAVRNKFHSNRFFPWTTRLWDRLPRGWFPDLHNLNQFKSRAKHYLPPTILINWLLLYNYQPGVLPGPYTAILDIYNGWHFIENRYFTAVDPPLWDTVIIFL